MPVPDYLTRYYQKGEYPFLSLNDLPFEEANKVKRAHCEKCGIGEFYAQDDYLVHRKEIENWIYKELVRLGGKPEERVPVYMMLGESPEGKYDIRGELQKDCKEIKIPIKEIDMSAVTFTYPDSMYEFVLDTNGNVMAGRRTNTPQVYMYRDVPSVVEKFKVYDDYKYNVEAQVWNRKMLHEYWVKIHKGEEN